MARHSQKYASYIKSRPWKERRDYLFALLPQKICARAGCPHAPTDCHHLHYGTLGDESLEDVEFLCPAHHEAADAERERAVELAREERQEEREQDYLDHLKEKFMRRKFGSDWRERFTEEFAESEFERHLAAEEEREGL